jgi:hypothetical protein
MGDPPWHRKTAYPDPPGTPWDRPGTGLVIDPYPPLSPPGYPARQGSSRDRSPGSIPDPYPGCQSPGSPPGSMPSPQGCRPPRLKVRTSGANYSPGEPVIGAHFRSSHDHRRMTLRRPLRRPQVDPIRSQLFEPAEGQVSSRSGGASELEPSSKKNTVRGTFSVPDPPGFPHSEVSKTLVTLRAKKTLI